MLSPKTLSYLFAQQDVNDQEIDALVEYAATKRPDAWQAIKLMHEAGQDIFIPNYILRLQDLNLNRLGIILPSIWKRFEAYQKLQERRQAEADAQPEAMQQQHTLQEMMTAITNWMRQQTVDVCTTTLCLSIEATAQANKVRCKQDWAGIVRMIRDEGEWLNKLTNNVFVQMVTERCHIDEGILPTESSLKALSFGKSKFPAWKVTGYNPQQLDSLVQMGTHFVRHLYDQVQQALKSEQKTPFAV